MVRGESLGGGDFLHAGGGDFGGGDGNEAFDAHNHTAPTAALQADELALYTAERAGDDTDLVALGQAHLVGVDVGGLLGTVAGDGDETAHLHVGDGHYVAAAAVAHHHVAKPRHGAVLEPVDEVLVRVHENEVVYRRFLDIAEAPLRRAPPDLMDGDETLDAAALETAPSPHLALVGDAEYEPLLFAQRRRQGDGTRRDGCGGGCFHRIGLTASTEWGRQKTYIFLSLNGLHRHRVLSCGSHVRSISY